MRAPRHYLLLVYLNSSKEKRETHISNELSFYFFLQFFVKKMQIQSSLLYLPKKFSTLSPEDTDERKETKNPNGSIFSETKTRLETLSNLALQKNHRPLLRVFTHTRVHTHTHTHAFSLSRSVRKIVNCPSAAVVVVVVASK